MKNSCRIFLINDVKVQSCIPGSSLRWLYSGVVVCSLEILQARESINFLVHDECLVIFCI